MHPIFTKTLLAAGLLLSGQSLSAQTYCIPTVPTPCADPATSTNIRINEVRTTGGTTNVSNATNDCPTTGYTYYSGTGNTVIANAGASVTCSVFVSTAAAYSYRCAVWVDWNDDGDFADAGENVYTSLTSQTAGPYPKATIPNSFKVPEATKEGMKRMRVFAGTRASGDITPTVWGPCVTPGANFLFGEYEDYDFYVVNPCIMNPVSIEDITDRSFTARYRSRANADMYEYFLSTVIYTTPPPPNGWDLTTDTVIKFPTPNYKLQCDKQYYLYVRSICESKGLNQNDWIVSDWEVTPVTTHQCCYKPEVTITDVTNTTANVNWTPVPTVQKYEYAVVASPAMVPTSGMRTTSTGVVVTGLAPGQEWYFYLRALCDPTPTSDWKLDSFLTKPPLGITNTSATQAFGITAYPNPAKDVVKLQLNNGSTITGKANVIVTDITGKLVATMQMDTDVLELNLSGKAAGTYIIKYADDAHTNVIHVYKQ